MSDTGLYSGLYSHIRVFAELFDSVLVKLKAGTNPRAIPEVQSLGALLVEAGERRAVHARAQLLGVILREGQNGNELIRIGKALMDATDAYALVPSLEQLAQRLEHERAGMFAKMRGREC
jgi:hypothetical protein